MSRGDGGEGSDPEVGEPLVSDPSSVAALLRIYMQTEVRVYHDADCAIVKTWRGQRGAIDVAFRALRVRV